MKIYPFFLQNAGCPHRCTFCAQDRSVGAGALPPVDQVVNELDRMLPQQGEGEIAFYGGSFSLLPLPMQDGYLRAAGQFVVAGRVSGIRISTRPDALDDSCVVRLKESRVTTVEIGCQSFDDCVLAEALRGHSAVDNVLAVERCKKAGLQVGTQLMPGLPGSTHAEAMSSLRAALALVPSFLRIYPAVVIEGTAMAQQWRNGGFTPLSLDSAVDICADMLHECRIAKIPVIRIGLQQDPQLVDNLLAGPYHPAFGQLVRSRLWRRAISATATAAAQYVVNPIDLSDAIGHAGENRDWFEDHCPGVTLKTDQTVVPGSFRVFGRELSLTKLLAPGGLHD